MTTPARPIPASVSVAAVLVAALAGTASAQPTVDYALGLAPFQKNVDFDKVTPEEAKSCSIKMEKEGGVNAWVVRGSRGEVLRSFADTNGDRAAPHDHGARATWHLPDSLRVDPRRAQRAGSRIRRQSLPICPCRGPGGCLHSRCRPARATDV